MSTGALIMMIGWQGFITFMAGYFFYKVLKSKPENDGQDDENHTAENH